MVRPFLLQYHSRPVTGVRFNQDGDLFLSSSNDGRVNLMRTENGERIGTYEGHGKSAVKSVDISLDSKIVVTAGADSQVIFYHAHNGEVIHKLNHGGIVKCVEFNQNPAENDRIVTCSDKFKDSPNCVSVWRFDFSSSEPICHREVFIHDLLPMKAAKAKWGPFDETLVSIHDEGTFCVWDIIADEPRMVKIVEAHTQAIGGLQFNSDRTLMLTASRDRTVKLWETQEYANIKKYESDRPFNDAAISPLYKDGVHPKYHIMAAGGVEARDAATTSAGGFETVFFNMVLEEEIGTIKGHFGPVNSVAVAPDGRSFVTGGEEGLMRLIHLDPDYFTRKDI